MTLARHKVVRSNESKPFPWWRRVNHVLGLEFNEEVLLLYSASSQVGQKVGLRVHADLHSLTPGQALSIGRRGVGGDKYVLFHSHQKRRRGVGGWGWGWGGRVQAVEVTVCVRPRT